MVMILEKIRIVICDTNPEELEGYAKICRAICADKRLPVVLTTFSNSQSLLFEMNDRAFSSLVSILVIEPDGGCEAVASTLRNSQYDGIILYLSRTMDKKYLYQAFDAAAFSYVQKGDMQRFSKVLEEAVKAADQLERQYIAVSCAGEYRQIDIRDIYYFETTMDHMICVWYRSGKFIFQSSLSNLEERLRDRGFFRLHRSFLVALDAIHMVSFDAATLNNGKGIPIGRGNYPTLKDALDKWRQ